jgi:hypothetical protein
MNNDNLPLHEKWGGLFFGTTQSGDEPAGSGVRIRARPVLGKEDLIYGDCA